MTLFLNYTTLITIFTISASFIPLCRNLSLTWFPLIRIILETFSATTSVLHWPSSVGAPLTFENTQHRQNRRQISSVHGYRSEDVFPSSALPVARSVSPYPALKPQSLSAGTSHIRSPGQCWQSRQSAHLLYTHPKQRLLYAFRVLIIGTTSMIQFFRICIQSTLPGRAFWDSKFYNF
jgi:hypothetical protein